MDYVDLTLVTEIDERPSVTSKTFIPQLDAGSVSTFGTVKDKKQTYSASLSRKISTTSPTTLVMSGVTLDS